MRTKTHILSMLVLVVLLAAAVPASAGGPDEPLRACTAQEIRLVVRDGQRFFPQVGDVSTRAGMGEDPLFLIYFDLNDLYVRWWRDRQPRLPDCAFSIRYQLTMSRALSQLYVTLLWSYEDSAELDEHWDLLDLTTAEVGALLDEIKDYSDAPPVRR